MQTRASRLKVTLCSMLRACLTAIITFGVLLFAPITAYANDIGVTVHGVPVDFPQTQPALVDGRTLVPIRPVFEALGFDVDWEWFSETAIMTREDVQIRITIGRDFFFTNGRYHSLDVPAQLVGGRVMVPLAAPLASVGYRAIWDGERRLVHVVSSEQAVEPSTPSQEAQPAEPAQPTQPLRDFEQEIFRLVNAERAAAGLAPLIWDEEAAQTARNRTINGRIPTLASGPLTIDRRLTATITAQAFFNNIANNERARGEILNPEATRLGIGLENLPQPQGNNTRQIFLFFKTPTWQSIIGNPLEWHNLRDAGRFPASNIVLPNRRQTDEERVAWTAEYWAMGGANAWEYEVVRLINLERAAYGLSPLQVDYLLMQSARHYTQQLVDLNLFRHWAGPYGGSLATRRSFENMPNMGNARSIYGGPGARTPHNIVAGWMQSPGHRAAILWAEATRFGAGTSFSAENGGRSYVKFGVGDAVMPNRPN